MDPLVAFRRARRANRRAHPGDCRGRDKIRNFGQSSAKVFPTRSQPGAVLRRGRFCPRRAAWKSQCEDGGDRCSLDVRLSERRRAAIVTRRGQEASAASVGSGLRGPRWVLAVALLRKWEQEDAKAKADGVEAEARRVKVKQEAKEAEQEAAEVPKGPVEPRKGDG